MDLSVEHIEQAARVIDPVFLGSPQFVPESLSTALGRNAPVLLVGEVIAVSIALVRLVQLRRARA